MSANMNAGEAIPGAGLDHAPDRPLREEFSFDGGSRRRRPLCGLIFVDIVFVV
jgi:hypothetical protein